MKPSTFYSRRRDQPYFKKLVSAAIIEARSSETHAIVPISTLRATVERTKGRYKAAQRKYKTLKKPPRQ